MVVWTPPEQATLAATAAQQTSFRGRIYFDAAAAGDLFLGAAAEATEKATLVFTQTMVIDDVIATTPAKAARRQWFQDYTARFGGYNGSSSFAADASTDRRRGLRPVVGPAGRPRRHPGRAGDVPDGRPLRPDPDDPGQPLRPDAAGADHAGRPGWTLAVGGVTLLGLV